MMMPRCLRFLHIAFGLAAHVLLLGTTSAQQTLTPIRATENVYYFQGDSGMASTANHAFNSNAAFIVTRDGVVVFDALGTPELGAAMRRAIATVTPQPIRVVIVSHFHADHFYGLQSLKGEGVEIWAHAAGRAAIGSEFTGSRLEQRRRDLAPYDDTVLVMPSMRHLKPGNTQVRLGRYDP